jgi:hypothetical protein
MPVSTYCRRAASIAVAATLCAGSPAGAHAAERTRIEAAFSPERLGKATAMSVGFEVTATDGGLVAPLTAMDLHYPADLGIATSGLGLATCAPALIEAHGPGVCPPNSLMGFGSALVEVPIGPEIVAETARIALVAGPSPDGYIHVLVAATGRSPVAARIVMPTLLLDGRLHLTVPLVEGLANGPDVSVARVRVTLGGNLTYRRRVRGRSVRYRPKGIDLPRRCPSGGFRFAATFAFLDGSHSSATTAVPCPAAIRPARSVRSRPAARRSRASPR